MKSKSATFLFFIVGLFVLVYFWRDRQASTMISEANISEISHGFPIANVSLGQDRKDLIAENVETIRFEGITERLANPLERNHDLYVIYEQYKNSKNPIERHFANRAWSACFPQFIAGKGQIITIEQLTAGFSLNDPQTLLRTNALNSLMGKCKNFFTLSREQLVQGTQREKEAANGQQSLSPGEMANRLRLAGNTQHALQLMRKVMESKDAFAIASLQDFVQAYFHTKIEEQSLPSSIRADLKGLAFSLAACELGLPCDADTLTAIQLCANSGECVGSLKERYLNRAQNPADKALLEAETRRVLEAIRDKSFALSDM